MAGIGGLNGLFAAFPERYTIPRRFSAVVVFSLSVAINSWTAIDRSRDFQAERENNEILRINPKVLGGHGQLCNDRTFDYIVVGAGGAGMIVATRLANASDSPAVLLLEAGGEPSLLNYLPSMDFFLMNQRANTWSYNSTRQQYSCGHCDDRKTRTCRGKMLGGTTSTNFMMYVRGNKEDYNRWQYEDAGGDPQWNYKNLLPYFLKSEDYHGAHEKAHDTQFYHGTGGLLNVATYNFQPGAKEFLKAAVEKGYKVGDYNGADQEVFSKIDVTTQNGWRESTYRAFYQDTGKPKNLCIKKYSQVIKVNIVKWDHENQNENKPRATGVEYVRFNKVHKAFARKEVILCAGAIETPKLLLLSGIGPKYDLEAFNIPVVKDLPVGFGMQDHVFTMVGPFLKSPSANINKDLTARAVHKFLQTGDGILAAPASLAGFGFMTSSQAVPKYPDLQFIQFSAALYPEFPHHFKNIIGFSEHVISKWLYPYHLMNTDARFILLVLGRPKSFGSLRLASRNPFDNPILNPRYLEHPDDTEALLYGFKKAVDLFENTKSLNKPLFHKPVPGCESHQFKSDSYYRCVIEHFSGSLYHHVGTCALGKVVDNNLKVKGISGLRVIDASIIPRTPNGNTQAPVFMVAEKGVDLILSENDGDRYKSELNWAEKDEENEIDNNELY